MSALRITRAFDQIHFDDATIDAVSATPDRLCITFVDVALHAGHPDNPHATVCTLEHAALVVDAPFTATSQTYRADGDHWAAPAPALDTALRSLAEVAVDAAGDWTITGFADDGRWIRWNIAPQGRSSLVSPPPAADARGET